MRYRYITSPTAEKDSPIKGFRLISNVVLSRLDLYTGYTYIRICVDDVSLTKYSCDDYSTTEDTRTLGELGLKRFGVMFDGSIKELPEDMSYEDREKFSQEQIKEWTIHNYRAYSVIPERLYPDCDYFTSLRDSEYAKESCFECYRYNVCLDAYRRKEGLIP